MFKWSRRVLAIGIALAFLLAAASSTLGATITPFLGTQSRSAGNVAVELAPAAFSWYDGLSQYSKITNCASIIQGLPYQENGAGTYVGFFADPNAGKPAPNTTYYVHVVVAGLGNSCSGQRAFIDVALPSNTALAIDTTNHVYCFYDGVLMTPSECPQSLPSSPYNVGAYEIPSTDAAHAYTWPIPRGRILEIQIPVKSTTALSNSPFQANVWMLDGNSSPWLRPQQGIYVFSSQPTILYPSPSTISITASYGKSQAYLYSYGLGGTGYFDLGTDTSYSLLHDTVPIAAGSTAWLAWDDWTPPPLTPDTLYHWRFRFNGSNGLWYYGADQTFRTLPDGQVTVGNGSAASCTPSALNSAFGTAKQILFDCGSVPITITMSAGRSIVSDLTINGGNKVTLDAGLATNHFDVQSGAQLTLTQVALVQGVNNVTCGGAIHVLNGGRLTLNETRFVGNTSFFQGGALCVGTGGFADIRSTLFMSNTTTFSHGGAIGNYGVTGVSDSRFAGNRAATNGGAVDTTVLLTVTNSTFYSNTAGYRGGGINNYVGTMIVSGSSFISNTAGMYGGGVSNDAGPATVQTSSFSSNAGSSGGGLENSGTLTLTNSTVSGNHATTSNGGGLVWVAGLVTLLNNTFADNTASALGGNFYVGGADNPSFRLKNTLMASGSPANCDHKVSSQGNNLEDANSCGLTAGGDLVNTNPRLGPLQDNGGATWTQALLSGSPAIDAGTNSGCPATDQRGIARPLGFRCDIGAYEYRPTVYLPLVIR